MTNSDKIYGIYFLSRSSVFVMFFYGNRPDNLEWLPWQNADVMFSRTWSLIRMYMSLLRVEYYTRYLLLRFDHFVFQFISDFTGWHNQSLVWLLLSIQWVNTSNSVIYDTVDMLKIIFKLTSFKVKYSMFLHLHGSISFIKTRNFILSLNQ